MYVLGKIILLFTEITQMELKSVVIRILIKNEQGWNSFGDNVIMQVTLKKEDEDLRNSS